MSDKEVIEQSSNQAANSSSALFQENFDNQSEFSSTLSALMYKSRKLQQRNYCSNICQIVTPLLCIAFTLAVQLITKTIVSGKIQAFDFPQPLDIPIFYSLTSSLGLTCEQHFVYQIGKEVSDRELANKLLNHSLKFYCSKTDSLMPQITQKQNANEWIFKQLKIADVQPFERGDDLKTVIPDGMIKIKDIEKNILNVTYGINDIRLPEYHRNNGITKIAIKTSQSSTIVSYLRVTQGMMMVMEKINRAFLQLSNPKQVIMGSFMYMPFDGEDTALINKIINILGSGLYPLGLSLLLPLFLFAIVSQKEQRLVQIMKMNGLNLKFYWVNVFIFNFMISMITFALFYLFGKYAIALTFFTETGFSVFWALLIGWAIAQISLTNLVQIFINSAKTATIIGYLLSIFSCLIGETITTFIYAYPEKVPLKILLFPPFALCRGIYLIGYNCASNGSCYRDLLSTQPQFINILIILYGWFLVYLASIWLNDMVQQQYGVAKYPMWVTKIIQCLKKQKKVSSEQLVQQNSSYEQDDCGDIQMNENPKAGIDQSIPKQNQKIKKMATNAKPMIIRQLSKKYQLQSSENQDYIALKSFSLALNPKEIFGLLGPNGAGKTTLISVLTGMYPQTSGLAWINGLPVGNSHTNKFIGVCPQFDLLWPDLTVEEHLHFYALLKKVNSQRIDKEIAELLRDVDLVQWADTPSSQLSGGMQRRLSLAISLVGNPKVVFLDQPSSGLDPSHRRQMWNILLKCKKRTSILLTTHLMEQAQVLCDRVGIISKGQLRCVGQISQMKQTFGKGYRLTISYSNLLKVLIGRGSKAASTNESLKQQANQEESQYENLRPEVVQKIIQKYKGQIVNELNTRIILKIDKKDILACINELKHQQNIHWLVSQPSLYDVFVHFVK